MIIRRERPDDADAVFAVHAAAFDTDAEAQLVATLRTDGDALPELSLVAELDGAVVAHVVTSRGTIVADNGEVPSLGLGPIGVLPQYQGLDIGSALMHASIGAADALGEPLVALLGNPVFYSKFGFVAAAEHGVEPPEADWGPYFQVRTLASHDPSVQGQFRYPSAFDGV